MNRNKPKFFFEVRRNKSTGYEGTIYHHYEIMVRRCASASYGTNDVWQDTYAYDRFLSICSQSHEHKPKKSDDGKYHIYGFHVELHEANSIRDAAKLLVSFPEYSPSWVEVYKWLRKIGAVRVKYFDHERCFVPFCIRGNFDLWIASRKKKLKIKLPS